MEERSASRCAVIFLRLKYAEKLLHMKYIIAVFCFFEVYSCRVIAQSNISASVYSGVNLSQVEGVQHLHGYEPILSTGLTYGVKLSYLLSNKLTGSIGIARQLNWQKFENEVTTLTFELAYFELSGFLGYRHNLSDKLTLNTSIGVKRNKVIREYIYVEGVNGGLPTVVFFDDLFYSLVLREEAAYNLSKKVELISDLWLGVSTFQEQKYYSLGLSLGLKIYFNLVSEGI